MVDIKAIIFDMDGVLLDAKEWHYNALKKALGVFGFEMNRYDHVMKFDGLPTKEKLNLYSREYHLPEELHAFINELKQSYTIDEIYTHAKPNFLHEFALSSLKNNGFKIALASNSISNTVSLAMKKVHLIDYFDVIMSNSDVKKSKPDPQIYNLTIQKLNLNPENCLILEDNENGIKAAIASKAHLMKIDTVNDVNYENIMSHIERLK
jgi:HAD superfamily hydrolase (TIGR01509 family)